VQARKPSLDATAEWRARARGHNAAYDSRVSIKVGIDQGVDLKALRRIQEQGIIELRQANELEQTWDRYVTQQKKGFMPGHSRLGGPDVLANDKAAEVEKILGPGNENDVAHIYAAYMNECEYFVTENPTDFIDGGRREKLEPLLGLKIRRTLELTDDLTQEGYLFANDESPRVTWRYGYLVVLAGTAGFVVSCFAPFYGGGLFGPGSDTVSLWRQGTPGGDTVASVLARLLFLFGGVATVGLLAIAGLTRRGPLAATTVLAAAVAAWSLTWIGIMISQATIGLGITLEWGFWLQALSVGVVVIGTVLAVARGWGRGA
jgi:hypothetical protein